MSQFGYVVGCYSDGVIDDVNVIRLVGVVGAGVVGVGWCTGVDIVAVVDNDDVVGRVVGAVDVGIIMIGGGALYDGVGVGVVGVVLLLSVVLLLLSCIASGIDIAVVWYVDVDDAALNL